MYAYFQIDSNHPAIDELADRVRHSDGAPWLFRVSTYRDKGNNYRISGVTLAPNLLSWWVDQLAAWPDHANRAYLILAVSANDPDLIYPEIGYICRTGRTKVVIHAPSWRVNGLLWSTGKALIKAHNLQLAKQYGRYEAYYRPAIVETPATA